MPSLEKTERGGRGRALGVHFGIWCAIAAGPLRAAEEAWTKVNRGQASAATQILETLVLAGPDHAAKVEAQRLQRELARQEPPISGPP